MKSLSSFLIAILLLAAISSVANAQLERGVKGEMEDVILLGADDWHTVIASMPLAIWSEDNNTIVKPLLILPKNVNAGIRMGWVEQIDLDKYGVNSVLHTFKSANITAIIVHGKGDQVKSLVEAAHKEGLKTYITASLEIPMIAEPHAEGIKVIQDAKEMLLSEGGLESQTPDMSHIDQSWLQVPNPTMGGNASYFCPVNPEVKDYIYNQIETFIQDYKADGVVLYRFGFQDENYCFCNFCKEKFYKDTGIDLAKVYANSYNLERWNQWKQEQVLEIVREAANISKDLGPAELGVALGNPFDRSQGYNFAQISKSSDFTIISPISASDVKLASGISEKPVYIRLSDDYVAYVLSTQNVEGAVKYIEDLTQAGSNGFVFDYDVVFTPLWSELEPPSGSAQWLLHQLDGKSLGIGNVSWKSDSMIYANNSFELAGKLSNHWKSSPGAIIVGENYSSALSAVPIASYLNWPLLFVDKELPIETSDALKRLNAKTVVIVGYVTEKVRQDLREKNLTIIDGNSEFLLEEMKKRGESPSMVIMTNSRDLSLQPPVPKTEIRRAVIGDLLANVDISPSQLPAEEIGQIVRLNVTLTNSNSKDLKDVGLLDFFPTGKLIILPRPSEGTVNVTDPYTGHPSDASSSFINGSLLRWKLDKLSPGESASLNMEVELLYPMDSGWKQRLDYGSTAAYEGFAYNHTLENKDDWPIINVTYPTWIFAGRANISWNLDRTSSYTSLNLYSPDGRSGSIRIKEIEPNKIYNLRVPLLMPGKWKFNIEAGDGYTHRTENYTIDVRSNIPPINITAFSHTEVPRLSLVAAQAAAARKALLYDVAKDPQEIDPLKEEEVMKQRVEDLRLSPKYLMVVGDLGSLPFIFTGLKQEIPPIKFNIYRDYQLNLDEGNYSEVAVGRILGLSLYDASQLLARTLAYDHLNGTWKNNSVVISSPPLSFPQAPVAKSIAGYLKEAGLNVKDLRYEEATYQQAVSQMNNGQNIVHFDHHGNEGAWSLSTWSMIDPMLTEAHVKQLVLSPQTTTATACVTSNLKGFSINVSGTEMYIPRKLDDSIALAFIRAGAVNYIGESALSWIFISDDWGKKFYQSLIFENSTVGQAQVGANNLYELKFRGADSLKKNLSEYNEILPLWDSSIQEMLNQTAYMDVIIGDPSFRPSIPKTPPLPYTEEVKTITDAINATGKNASILEASITPVNETATDWIYWIETDTTDGKLRLNAPPAIIAEVSLPKDAEKIVVKENGLGVWHDEDVVGDRKRVMWPAVSPRLGEDRSFQVEYVIIPGQVQSINVTAGWNAVSIYLDPKDPSVSKYLKNKPYRGIFSVTGEAWDFTMKDVGMSNVTEFEPGEGYLIDSEGNFSLKISGKPVDIPYRLILHKGWNMIGLPVNKSVDLNNITVNAEHKKYKYPEAVQKGAISAFVWSYDGKGWSHLGENETLVPGKAYMIEALSDVRLEFKE